MRVRNLLLVLSFVVVGLTSGCHHRHCCWGGGGCFTPCCAPACGCCCGYGPTESAMPPLAAPVVAPHMPTIGPR